ncbi:hypothetical protein ACJMK2_015939 [Sinanodonta woodiana]|uniref:Uncharacterized protein n=1 Tax=Sinanodonta woodiana TaxID=1069815 RepID=A0ABD3US97_SINWO
MTGMASKRKYEDFIICVSVIAKCGKSNKKNFCTWDDVYHDITNDTDFRPHKLDKADVLNVILSDKLDGTMTFQPDLHEGLHVVKEFNQRLKYVTFTVTLVLILVPLLLPTVTRDESVGLDDVSLVGQNVRQTVNCCTKLTARDQRALTHTLEKYDYTCGSVITLDGDILQGKVFVRLQLSCAVHIEFPYYASNIGRPDICAHCGAIGAEKSQEMTGRFRTVLPVCHCQQCLASGKDLPKRNPVKN